MGRMAEDIALNYLLARGLSLRDRNWRCRHLEVDLVMESERELHIVEVRSRRYPAMMTPSASVDRKKQGHLIRAASSYVRRKKIDKDVVFDIVSIVFYKDNYHLEYIENAFLPFF